MLDFLKRRSKIQESIIDKEMLARMTLGTVLDWLQMEDDTIILRENEYCFFKDYAKINIEKEKIEGYKSEGNGLSAKIATGIFLRGNVSRSTAIKKMKEIEYKGFIYLTNYRIIFINEEIGFEKNNDEVTSIIGETSQLLIQFGSKSYRFTTTYADVFKQLFREINLFKIDKLPKVKRYPEDTFDKDKTYSDGIEDPLYYLIGSGLIKYGGETYQIYKRLHPAKMFRIYNVAEALKREKVISDSTDDNPYKIIMSYDEWIKMRISSK